MPHAVIDWSLSETIPVLKDRRTTQDPRKLQVFELFAQGKKNAEIASITDSHRNTISNWRKDWRLPQAA
jgi:DNA-binding NarL/FixJ family response regulator